jgi:hypothetical protein
MPPVLETREKYLAGKPRVRVRGNLNNARDLGIICREVTTDDDNGR